jgi:sugar lactone lactonase YvrE
LRIPVHEKEPELPICEEHEEKMKAFCETHDVLICSICLGMDHQKPCVVKRIHEVVQRKKFIAEKKLTVLQKMKGRVEESIEDCNHLFVNLDLDEQTLIQGIRREYAKLKENVEFQKANLQGILETINELPSHFKSLNNVSDTLFPIEVIQLLKFLPKTTFYNSIYACDSQHHQVTVFDLNDFSLMDSFGGYGHEDGNLCSPCSVTVDFNGFVYISEQSNHRIHVFQSTENGHEFIRKWGLYGNQDGQLMSPGGITTDLDGHVYVCDRGNYRIQVFRSDGTFLRKWGSSGNSDGQFESPNHIAVDKKGFVYVCDSSLERVQVFHVNGRFVSKWGNRGSGDGEFSGIFGIAIGEDGLVYISEISNHRIQVFQFDGTFVRKWGSRGSGNSQFNQPKDLLIDHFGFVHVFDSRNNRVSHFTSTGEFLGNLESSDSRISCFSGAALALL